jgi:hypothetical protein
VSRLKGKKVMWITKFADRRQTAPANCGHNKKIRIFCKFIIIEFIELRTRDTFLSPTIYFKNAWQRYKFYTFPISFKKEIVLNSWHNECIPPILIDMSTLILIFLWNEITFCFSCGFFVDLFSVFWEFINGFFRVCWEFKGFLIVSCGFNEGFLLFFFCDGILAQISGNFFGIQESCSGI